MLFVSQFYPVCDFGKCVNFGLNTFGIERVKVTCPVADNVQVKAAVVMTGDDDGNND